MKPEFFKPSDFNISSDVCISFDKQAANFANAKLEREAVKVYTNGNQSCFTLRKEIADDHQAFVINIQPIKECEHKKVERIGYEYCPITGKTQFDIYECQDCNKQLEPTGWRVKE